MTGGGDLGGFSMLELFRAEVETHAAAFDENLVSLESDPRNPVVLEAMMRAAHSIKGAARIVGVGPAVKLAHAMEDCFVAAQQGTLVLGGGAIDALLAGADALRTIGGLEEASAEAWFAEHAGELEALADRIQRAAIEEAAPAPDATPPEARVDAPAADEPTPDASAADVPAAVAPAPEPKAEGDVRVHARSLGRMLAFAGESVVEARRLAGCAEQMERLKNDVGHLTVLIDRIEDGVATDAVPGLQDALGGLRGHVARARRALIERIEAVEQAARRSDDVSARLYREVLQSRMRPFGDGVAGFPRLVRDVGRELGKSVQLEIVGRDVAVDRDILERLDAPIGHMLRNAVDHGLEPAGERLAAGKPEQGRLRLEARHASGMLEVVISDDGRGIDPEALRDRVVDRELIPAEIATELSREELLEFLFLPGFSTKEDVSEISGRGVGLDVVHTMVKEAGGVIRTTSTPGDGTRFLLVLPITRSVIRAAIVKVAGQPFAFPLTHVDRLVRVESADVADVEGRQHFVVDGSPVGLVPAAEILRVGEGVPSESVYVVVLGAGTGRYGLAVDGFVGEQDLVVRPLDPRLGDVSMISAAALDDDGDVVLIADVQDLLRSIDQRLHEGRLRSIHVTARERLAAGRRKRVLVVDDSITVREVERNLLENRGYAVDVAVDGSDAWKTIRGDAYDLVITDVDMPRMDGIELVRRIKQDAGLSRIPVMIVSYKDREEDRLRGLEAGADMYLTKGSFHDETWIASVVDLIGEPEAE